MTCFEEKEKEETKEKIKEKATINGYVIEDTNSKYLWKFKLKQNSNK